MTCNVSQNLSDVRTQFLLDLAKKNKGKVYPDQFLKAVDGNKKLVLNILWIARRCGYVSVKQIRDGRRISYWQIDVIGKCPEVKGSLVVTESKLTSTKTVKTKNVKSNEQIKAANLAKMKKVSAKLSKRKIKKDVDLIVNDSKSKDEIGSTYNIDPAWDSTEGLDIKKLVA